MSRVGKAPVVLPQGVKVKVERQSVFVEGPKGRLDSGVPEGIQLNQSGDRLVVDYCLGDKQGPAYRGLVRALINNMVKGVTVGFSQSLDIVGVGYRAQVRGSNLVLNLGYSHPIEYALPKGVTAKVEAAEEAGLKKVIIPKMNEKDVIKEGRKIKIIGVERIEEVLEHSLKDSKEKKELISLLKKLNEEDKGDKGSGSGNKTKKKRSRKKE